VTANRPGSPSNSSLEIAEQSAPADRGLGRPHRQTPGRSLTTSRPVREYARPAIAAEVPMYLIEDEHGMGSRLRKGDFRLS
jgi:hypothetical protein